MGRGLPMMATTTSTPSSFVVGLGSLWGFAAARQLMSDSIPSFGARTSNESLGIVKFKCY